VVAVLARMCARAELRSRAEALLSPAVRWLLAQRNDGSAGTCFSYYAGRTSSSRIAWCYGDPGVALALMAAAQVAGERTWRDAALSLTRHSIDVDFETTQVVDASLCHGGAGLLHFFGRMYNATGDDRHAAAARDWLRWTLDFRATKPGATGFASLQPRTLDAADKDWVDDPGLLMGAAGVGLALLAAIATREPGWDAPLLMDIRPAEP
jgi:rhamnogalacturonyl hydrolase YesR